MGERRGGLLAPPGTSRRAAPVGAFVLLLLVALAGCGEGAVGGDAAVAVYVSAPLHGDRASEGRAMCAGARRAAARAGGRVGDIRVRVGCLDDTDGGRRWSLAAVGANARRATEDSTTVGYIGEPDPRATRFSRPIVGAAGIAQLSTLSGSAAMAKLLQAIRNADSSKSLRESVHESLR